MAQTPIPGNPMGDGSRQFSYPSPVNVGWDYARGHTDLLPGGLFITDRKHLGIGVRDQALIKPTGDPVMSTDAYGHAAKPGAYVPAGGGFGPARTTAQNKTDGNTYTKTLNPAPPMNTLATQEVVYTDLAGNGGVLQGTFNLSPLLDFQTRNQTGSGAVGG